MSIEALTLDGWKLLLLTATGPATAVSVPAGGTANVDLTIEAGPAIKKQILGLKEVTGLPVGVALAGVSTPDLNTLRLVVFNPTSAAVTIGAGSVSAVVLVKAY